MNAFLFPVKIILCRKLHCQNVLQLKLFSFKIGRPRVDAVLDRGEEAGVGSAEAASIASVSLWCGCFRMMLQGVDDQGVDDA